LNSWKLADFRTAPSSYGAIHIQPFHPEFSIWITAPRILMFLLPSAQAISGCTSPQRG